MMSLLQFLRRDKAATDVDKDDRSRQVCLISQCEIRFVTWFAEAVLPQLHGSHARTTESQQNRGILRIY